MNSKKKINKYAFSGGQTTTEEQRRLGGNPTVDVSYQYLTFFIDDDEELESIRQAYLKGELLTGELKARCIKELQKFVGGFQERRKAVTEEMVDTYMRARPLEWGKGKQAAATEPETRQPGLAEKVVDLAERVKETVLGWGLVVTFFKAVIAYPVNYLLSTLFFFTSNFVNEEACTDSRPCQLSITELAIHISISDIMKEEQLIAFASASIHGFRF